MTILGDKLFVNIFMKSIQNFETVLACSYGAQVEYFDKKKCRKSRDTFPLTQILALFVCVNISLKNQ